MAITTTALTLIKGAFDLLGVMAPGESLPAADGQDALRRLNQLVDRWGVDRLTIPVETRSVYPTVASQGGPANPYTVGPGGDFDQARPVWVRGVNLLLNSSSPAVEIPLYELNDDEYRVLNIKALESTLPQSYYYEGTSPLGSLIVWPIPDNTTNDLVLYWDETLSQFADLTTSYTFRPGYAEALEWQLAMRLAPAYAKPITPDLRAAAMESLSYVKQANLKVAVLGMDPGLVPAGGLGYNIKSDTTSGA